jgi:hypothetical protein
MEFSRDFPIMPQKTRYEIGELGFREVPQIGYVRNVLHRNGNKGTITISKDEVTYVLRNPEKDIIRNGKLRFSTDDELNAAIKSAVITMDYENEDDE